MDISFQTLLNAEIKMLIPVAIGFFIAKIGILNPIFSKGLSKLLLNVLNVCFIFSAVCGIDRKQSSLKEIGTVALVSVSVHTIALVIACLTTVKMKKPDVKSVVRASIIFRNTGFVGIPILYEIFGEKGAFWGAINVVVFNILYWTLCVYIYSQAGSSSKIEIKKIFLNPGFLTCVVGLVVFFTGLPVYTPIAEVIKNVGNACTPIAMLLVGGILSRLSLKKAFTSLPTFHTCALSLVVVPIAVMLILKVFGVRNDFIVFGTIIMALPTASNNVALSERDGICPALSAQIAGFTTVFTLITIPLLSFLLK